MLRHHLPAEALVAYAAGATTHGEDLLVACHLSVCPACRRGLHDAERVGEALAFRAAPAETAPGSLDRLLAALPPAPPAAANTPPPCPVFPAPLRRAVGPLESLPWRNVGFGVCIAPVSAAGGQRTFLLDFPPGFRLPSHGHSGVERGLVLRGGFTADGAVYARGDVSWCEEPHHDVVVDDDGERCTTLFVNDGPVEVGSAWASRLVDWWLGVG